MKLRSPSGCRAVARILSCLPPLAAGFLLAIPGGVSAQEPGEGGGDPPEPSPGPTLYVEDITAPGTAYQDLIVQYPWGLDVDPSSLGDGDLIVAGADGYLQRAQLIGVSEVDVAMIDPIDPNLAGGLEAPELWPGGWPILVANYRVFPPRLGEVWRPEDNGSYTVRLVEGEVISVDGSAVAPKLLGGFRVAIRDGEPEPLTIQPVETRIHVGRRPAEGLFVGEAESLDYYATVQLFFDVPHVAVEFSELVREGGSFVANVRATQLAMPDPEAVPILGADGGQVVMAVRSHTYQLGPLGQGAYRFVVRVNGEREGGEEFVVGDDLPGDGEPPSAGLRAAGITMAHARPQRLEVIYEDRGGIDVDTIGDGDVMVLSPCALLDVFPPFPCDWEAQAARFVEIVSVSDDLRRVVALYEIDPPSGGWTDAHNGFYPVEWRVGEVCDRSGNCNLQASLGGFEVAIRPDVDPPVPATASVRVDASDPQMVTAKVRVEFDESWMVVGQEIRRDGNRIILEAKAEALVSTDPPVPPPAEDLLYEIGPLPEGGYIAAFRMNGHLYGMQEFLVGTAIDPPIPAEVRMEVDAREPGNVFAVVSVQFRTPHELVPGEIRREDHQILLPAKARPLPVPDVAAGVLPEPIRLRYPIGALPPGGYVVSFEMNDFPYATQRLMVGNPEPPIPADVRMEIATEDPSAVVARVKVQFQSPHVITARGLVQDGRRFLLEASARPVREGEPLADPADPADNTVVLEFSLGDLEPGEYSAEFIMNGFPYAAQGFVIRRGGEFEADVELGVDAGDPTDVRAKVSILFEDKYVIVENPGKPRREGNSVIIDAAAIVATFVQEPEHLPIDLSYELGEFRPGEYVLVYRINGNPEARTSFVVGDPPPIPAEATLAVKVAGSAATAHARIQFRDHYRITDRKVTREGGRFFIDLEVDGPLPILAPLPPPPIELEIPLADQLEDGSYVASLRMDGYLYAGAPFEVRGDDPFAVEVELAVELGGGAVAAVAVVDFKSPYVQITDPGLPVRNGQAFEIRATAEELVFVQEPSGDPQRFSYDLGSPPPGSYGLIYYINGRAVGHQRFRIEEDPQPPVAQIAGIAIAQGDASWFADVGVILLPGQRVTDWGLVRQSGSEFHVEITVDWSDFPDGPAPDGKPLDPALVPDGIVMINAAGDGLIGDAPVRIVRHQYVLGIVDPGEKIFLVHSRGQTVARKPFVVPGTGPMVQLRAEDLTEATERPYRFSISYSDPDGLDHESIQNAPVMVRGPDGSEEPAILEEYASTDDVPSTSATAVYTLVGPGGDWDPRDSGRYCITVDPQAIRDLGGNTISNDRLGCFQVRILAEPPATGAELRIATSLVEGEWFADVEIVPAVGTIIRVDDWGQVIHHGNTHFALATVVEESNPDGAPVEPLAHRYPLGFLRPGYHVFAFKTNLAHCGLASFQIPGMEGDPVEDWRDAAGARDGEDDGDRDRNGILAEYFFALDPTRPDAPELFPEIVEDASGSQHLAIRYRRLLVADGVREVIEVSDDLRRWEAGDGLTEIIQQDVHIDGTEERLVCLRESLSESQFRWIRIRLIRE